MDKLIRGVARNSRVRVMVADTTELVQTAKQKHNLWPTSAAALGRTLSVATMMGSMLKSDDEKVTIQINGGGPIGTILVRAYHDGRVKGFVGDPEIMLINNHTKKLDVATAVGTDGYLKVSKDMGLKNEFIGQVELISGELGEDFAYYFNVSEQTPSFVSVGVLIDEDSNVKSAGGLIIQLMPKATEEDIVFIENAVSKLESISKLIEEGKEPIDIVRIIFDDFEQLAESTPYFECDCSKERMFVALTSLAKEELEEIVSDEQECEMYCEFCNTRYNFSKSDIQAIIDKKNRK